MWFVVSIIERLSEARDWLWSAQSEVAGWIFPFYYLSYPLYGLYVAFYYLVFYWDAFSDWLTWANTMLGDLPTVWTFWVYFQEWFEAGWNAWVWVINAIGNVRSVIDNWWTATMSDVQGWIEVARQRSQFWIDNLQDQITIINATLSGLGGLGTVVTDLLSWFTDWPGNVSTVINTWWIGALQDVQGLINTGFTVREDYWRGWQDWRSQITEFFTDPEDQVIKLLERALTRLW